MLEQIQKLDTNVIVVWPMRCGRSTMKKNMTDAIEQARGLFAAAPKQYYRRDRNGRPLRW
jgi:hypothetical protein